MTDTIYTLCCAEDIGSISAHFVDKEEDIRDLAIEQYWGTLIDVPDGLLEIDVDMTLMVVSIQDTHNNITTEYNIIAFDRRQA
jgi:hypothetical protein